MNSQKILLFIIILCLAACSSETDEETGHSEIDLQGHVSSLDNLTIYSPDTQDPDTVELIKETVFESNEDVFLPVFLQNVIVDKQERVFIAGAAMDYVGEDGIYVFQPDGSYLSRIGRSGRGPGEFSGISDMDIWGGQLYVLDSSEKISIFSLDDFTLSHEELVKRELIKDTIEDIEELTSMVTGRNLYVVDEDTILMKFESRMISEGHRRIFFYTLSGDGTILPGKLLELKHFRFYNPEMSQTSRGIFMPFTMPFSRSSVFAISNDGLFFTAWTEDFLIKVYDHNGNYLRSFYYPHPQSPVSLSEISMHDLQRQYLEKSEVPNTWPVIHTMELDDEGRLWVATITESETTFQWRVLNQQGELLASFRWPGERASRSAEMSPLIVIRNGYFYTRETDEETDYQRIVKHKITFKPQ